VRRFLFSCHSNPATPSAVMGRPGRTTQGAPTPCSLIFSRLSSTRAPQPDPCRPGTCSAGVQRPVVAPWNKQDQPSRHNAGAKAWAALGGVVGHHAGHPHPLLPCRRPSVRAGEFQLGCPPEICSSHRNERCWTLWAATVMDHSGEANARLGQVDSDVAPDGWPVGR
jgi:hypothetical protein